MREERRGAIPRGRNVTLSPEVAAFGELCVNRYPWQITDLPLSRVTASEMEDSLDTNGLQITESKFCF